MFIKKVVPSLIKDSRKEKTIQIEISTLRGKFKASAPSGESKGKYEALAYNARGIHWSFKMLKVFCNRLMYKNFMIKNFEGLEEFESTIRKFEERFGRFGANSVIALETAFLKAAAKENHKELWEFIKQDKNKIKIPIPLGNCIGGGLHSFGLRRPDFQEFLFIPQEKTFSRAVTKNIRAHEKAARILRKRERKWKSKLTDENALHTSLTNEDVMDVMQELSEEMNLKIGLDIAASSFFKNYHYYYEHKRLIRDRGEQIDYMRRLIEKYNVFYLEDPLQQEDFSGFSDLMKEVSSKTKSKTLITGDDLTVTNLERVKKAVKKNAINAIIIKPNQNGSILQTAEVVRFCKEKGLKIILSHRSGETMDDALADFAVGFGADFIKAGILGRERLIKLRRVIEIEKSL